MTSLSFSTESKQENKWSVTMLFSYSNNYARGYHSEIQSSVSRPVLFRRLV